MWLKMEFSGDKKKKKEIDVNLRFYPFSVMLFYFKDKFQKLKKKMHIVCNRWTTVESSDCIRKQISCRLFPGKITGLTQQVHKQLLIFLPSYF